MIIRADIDDRVRLWGLREDVVEKDYVLGCLLCLLAPAVPPGTPVHVLCDQGLGSRTLWQQIVDLGWHPVLRYPLHITFRPTGGDRVPAQELGGGPGTLVVLQAQGHQEPWLLLTDTVPDRTDMGRRRNLSSGREWILL